MRAVPLGVTDDRQGADDQQLSKISIALLGDPAHSLFAAARVLLRHEPDPRRQVPPRLEGLWIAAGHVDGLKGWAPTCSKRQIEAYLDPNQQPSDECWLSLPSPDLRFCTPDRRGFTAAKGAARGGATPTFDAERGHASTRSKK